MTPEQTQNIKSELNRISQGIDSILTDGKQYGEEISNHFEAGYYIGSLKVLKDVLKSLAENIEEPAEEEPVEEQN
jgi:coenzyme F420-reducing hydrogenase delta subunit